MWTNDDEWLRAGSRIHTLGGLFRIQPGSKGHAACHILGRTREEWGQERAEELAFFDSGRLKDCLDVSLSRVTETLKAAEEKLRAHPKVLVSLTRDNHKAKAVAQLNGLIG